MLFKFSILFLCLFLLLSFMGFFYSSRFSFFLFNLVIFVFLPHLGVLSGLLPSHLSLVELASILAEFSCYHQSGDRNSVLWLMLKTLTSTHCQELLNEITRDDMVSWTPYMLLLNMCTTIAVQTLLSYHKLVMFLSFPLVWVSSYSCSLIGCSYIVWYV